VEIDIKIARYRGIAEGVNDRRALEAAAKLIMELEAEKLALHPDAGK
jgi:hypothetical protein